MLRSVADMLEFVAKREPERQFQREDAQDAELAQSAHADFARHELELGELFEDARRQVLPQIGDARRGRAHDGGAAEEEVAVFGVAAFELIGDARMRLLGDVPEVGPKAQAPRPFRG